MSCRVGVGRRETSVRAVVGAHGAQPAPGGSRAGRGRARLRLRVREDVVSDGDWVEMTRQAQRRIDVRRLTEQLIAAVGKCRCGKPVDACLAEVLEFRMLMKGVDG